MKKNILFLGLVILAISIILSANIIFAADTPILKVSLLNQDPDPAQSGGEVELRFKVENIGQGTANSFELEILPQYPFTLVPGAEAISKRPALNAFESGDNAAIIKYRLKVDANAVEGTNKVKVRYKSADTGESTQEFDVSLSSKDKIEISKVSKTKIEPGKETEITFTLKNIGTTPFKNIAFSWSEKNNLILPVGSDNQKYVNTLGIGESQDLVFNVVTGTGVAAGLYALTTKIEYQDRSTTSTVNSNIGIVVGGETDFDITFSESSLGQTSLSVANIGSNPALSVTVRVPEQDNFRVQGSTASIVGNLDMGDYTIVSFQIASRNLDRNQSARQDGARQSNRDISSMTEAQRAQMRERFAGNNGNANNKLRVLIEYTDTTGTRRGIEKEVPIQFSGLTAGTGSQFSRGTNSQQQSFFSDKRVYIPLIVLALGILGYLFYNRKDYAGKLSKLLKK